MYAVSVRCTVCTVRVQCKLYTVYTVQSYAYNINFVLPSFVYIEKMHTELRAMYTVCSDLYVVPTMHIT